MTDQREQHKQELTELHDQMDDAYNDSVLRGISRSRPPQQPDDRDDKAKKTGQ